MKRIGITQRVVYVERIKERRDTLDQRWYNFANALGILLIPIPNNLKRPSQYVNELEIDGLIFSGGNNISFNGEEILEGKSIENDDVAYERDKTEIDLINWATKDKKPIIGVCRGMQVLNVYFGGRLSKVDSRQHVAKEHILEFDEGEFKASYLKESIVNSYHNWGIMLDGLAKHLHPFATYGKSEVEAFKHTKFPFTAIMWHPERYKELRNSDLYLFRKVFLIE